MDNIFFPDADQPESAAKVKLQTVLQSSIRSGLRSPEDERGCPFTKFLMMLFALAEATAGAGIKQVGEGLVNIGNSGRKATDSEINKYGLAMYKWAIDGVTAVVHPDNPVKSLSFKKLQDIYAGKIGNWKTLGGNDRPINIYTRDKSSGTRAVNRLWESIDGAKALILDPQVLLLELKNNCTIIMVSHYMDQIKRTADQKFVPVQSEIEINLV